MSDHPLAERTWTEVPDGLLLVVPLGATEQHGHHLPLGTDTIVATHVAAEVVEAIGAHRAVLAPALPYGASGEHAGFAGTLSIGAEALRLVIVELVRSATAPGGGPFGAVLLVCGHGGNAGPLTQAVALLRHEGRRVDAWLPTHPGGDAHAGRTETSVLAHLAPALVRSDATGGPTEPLAALLPALRAGGVRAVSASGVLGDPSGATPAQGAALVERWTAEATDRARALLAPDPA